MSFRGRGGRGGGGRGGGGFRGGRGGGGAGGRFQQNQNPGPLIEICEFSHTCKEQMIVKAIQEQNVPKFNRAICLENNTEIGNVDEIFGLFNAYLFSVKMKEGYLAKSYQKGQKFYMHLYDCLPLQKFLPRPKGQSAPPQTRGKFQRGGFQGNSFGGRQQQAPAPGKFDKTKFYANRPQAGNPATGGATKFIHK